MKADYQRSTTLTDHISYVPEGNDLEVYKRMNPLWSAQRGSAQSEWKSNEKEQHGYVHQVNGQRM